MLVNLDTKLLDPRGQEFSDKATIAVGLYAGLTAQLPTDQALGVKEKMDIFDLSRRVAAGGEQQFSASEIALMQERSGAVLPIIAFGALNTALES